MNPAGLSWVVPVLLAACSADYTAKGASKVATSETTEEQKPSELEFAHTIETMLLAGSCDELWLRFSPKAQKAFGSSATLVNACIGIQKVLGSNPVLGEETVNKGLGSHSFVRSLKSDNAVEGGGVAFQLSLSWNTDQKITGLLVKPDPKSPKPAPTQYNEYQTKTPLALPFGERWTVFWGGRTPQQNYHVAHASQHFAYDFVISKDERTHSGEGSENEDYYCFGKNILASGDGKVIEVIVGVKDNIPGVMNSKQVTGNHIIIDHQNGEYSLYAHLQLDSTAVKESQMVKQGEILGRCGNSGNSSEPHLHMHLQDKPRFGEGESMPAQFLNYESDGKVIARGEPTRLEQVGPVSK